MEKDSNNGNIETKTLTPTSLINNLFSSANEEEKYITENINNAEEFYKENAKIGDDVWSGLIEIYSATSSLKEKNIEYSVQNLNNYYINSCWAENAIGSGIGEKIQIEAFASSEKVSWESCKDIEFITHEDTINYILTDLKNVNIDEKYSQIKQIAIINGYAKNEKLFKNNTRIKKLKLTIDDKVEYILELEDTRNLQLFDINYENDSIKNKIKITAEILEAYKDEKYDDTCLTSLYLDGGANFSFGGR